MEPREHPRSDRDDEPAAARPSPHVWKSVQLLQGETEVLILHRGEFYRLRQTRNGKLILGK